MPNARRSNRILRKLVFAVGLLLSGAADASVSYTYDVLGRITTALYDNGLCIVYTYDANGNRTSQSSLPSGGPETPIWGTGVWGCFAWHQ